MSLDGAAETDRALMQRVQNGETDCFAELIRRYRPALVRVASSRLGQLDAAEDVVQETFLAAFKSRQSYDDRFGFRTWLWTILLNQCRRLGRRQARLPTVTAWSSNANSEQAAPIEPMSGESPNAPLDALLARERSAELQELLKQLTDVQADALRLRFFAGLKFDEIAGAMHCTPCTAKNRVRAGLQRLAQLLSGQPAASTDDSHDHPQQTFDCDIGDLP